MHAKTPFASGAAAETLRCFVVISSKRRWCIGSLDVTSAFLLTPIPQGKGFPVFALTPPRSRLLVRLGLAEEGEIWILTHAVYGLRESPMLWSDFRDCQLRALRCVELSCSSSRGGWTQTGGELFAPPTGQS